MKISICGYFVWVAETNILVIVLRGAEDTLEIGGTEKALRNVAMVFMTGCAAGDGIYSTCGVICAWRKEFLI